MPGDVTARSALGVGKGEGHNRVSAADRHSLMDLITRNLLDEFSSEYSISALPEDERFEHFAGFVTVRRHYSESFDLRALTPAKSWLAPVEIFPSMP